MIKSTKVHIRIDPDKLDFLKRGYASLTGLPMGDITNTDAVRWAIGRTLQQIGAPSSVETSLQRASLPSYGQPTKGGTGVSGGSGPSGGMVSTLVSLLSEKISPSVRYTPNGMDLLKSVEALLEDKADTFESKSALVEYIEFKISDESEGTQPRELWTEIKQIAEKEDLHD